MNLILLTFEREHHAVVIQERNLRGEITYNFYGDDAETYRFTQRHGILVKDVSEAEAEVDRINRKEFTHTASNQDVLAEDPSLWQTFQEKLDAKICMIQYVTGSASDYGITNEGRFFYEATRYDRRFWKELARSAAYRSIEMDRRTRRFLYKTMENGCLQSFRQGGMDRLNLRKGMFWKNN